ncbi:MAG: amidohydrolase family protein, partial [Stellaceae bacterium]
GRGGGGWAGNDDAAFDNLDEMLALAKYPNVAVKLSGAPSYSSEPYPYRNIHQYIRQIVDAFGAQRCFWGTDITRMPCSYRQCVTMFTEELPWLQGRDKELVMGRAIREWIGWKPDATTSWRLSGSDASGLPGPTPRNQTQSPSQPAQPSKPTQSQPKPTQR